MTDRSSAIPSVYRYERVDSTMDLVHALAEEGAPAGTIVIAGEQLAGRGARGRSWDSPLGGLWMSALYRPAALGGLEVVSLRVGLALAVALDPFVATPIRLKWPNDLMLEDRKLGGILCEARWQGSLPGWVAVGVGVNVRNPIPPELRQAAVSMTQQRPDVQIEDLIPPLVAALRLVDLQADRLSPAELAQFARRDWLTGRKIIQPLSGTVSGLAADGALLVRTADGWDQSLRTGSVELVGISPTG
jgi:BirA family biotin operon repressor/biotin-[acetyl-CoA-carboxylase] ligase